MSEPIPYTTTRYRCPSCSRSHSSKTRCRLHMARCWYNPQAKGCKTCKHHRSYLAAECDDLIVYNSDIAESCGAGIDLTVNPNCPGCAGSGAIGDLVRCGPCDGGTFLRVGCEKWESKDDEDEEDES